MTEDRPKPVVLAVLDGWGVAPDHKGNAITQGKTPNFDKFIQEYPVMTLAASSSEVGLSYGEMGNSEVGHLNIGAGRVYYQTLPRINKSIEDGTFFENEAFLKVAKQVKSNKSALHLIGLVSPGNVHASDKHCYALLEFAKRQKIRNIFVHIIMDGRDAQYNAGINFVQELQAKMKELGVGKIASLTGRYFALDRDNRWERVEKAYKAMVEGISENYTNDPIKTIQEFYDKEIFDEEFPPTVVGKEGSSETTIKSEDGVIFFNFRPDRARQLTQAFVLPGFDKFERQYLKGLNFVTMTEYEKELPVSVAFPPDIVRNCLAEVVSKAGLKQYHIAETEKYAHITFFLNGTVEQAFPNEDREIVPSPKVSSYDKAPEMSAPEITKKVIRAIESDVYGVIFMNFANADMVSHTGDFEAAKQGVEVVDKSLGKIAEYVLAKDGVLLITADHGNAEEVVNLQTGDKVKEHSTNPVPFIIIGNEYKGQAGLAGDPPAGDLSLMTPVGMLADVAPTVLKILGIEQPPEMTGQSLLP